MARHAGMHLDNAPDGEAAHQPYEPFAFARKHGITLAKARAIIERHGRDRKASDEAAMEAAQAHGPGPQWPKSD